MAAAGLFKAGSEEHDIQLKLRGELSETAGADGDRWPREIRRPEFYSHLGHQLMGMTLSLSLKLSGPSFHLKPGGDETCILTGIVRRIREIRKNTQGSFDPFKVSSEGWMVGGRLGRIDCQLQDVIRGVVQSLPASRHLPDQPAEWLWTLAAGPTQGEQVSMGNDVWVA